MRLRHVGRLVLACRSQRRTTPRRTSPALSIRSTRRASSPVSSKNAASRRSTSRTVPESSSSRAPNDRRPTRRNLERSWNPFSPSRSRRPPKREVRVEAGGIEPPSEGASTSESTCVARELISPRLLPRAGSHAASQRVFSAPAPPALTGTQPEVWRLSPPYGRRQVKRRYLIRQRVRSCRLQLSSPAHF